MKTNVKLADEELVRSHSFGQRRKSEVLKLKSPDKEQNYRSASAMTIGERMQNRQQIYSKKWSNNKTKLMSQKFEKELEGATFRPNLE